MSTISSQVRYPIIEPTLPEPHELLRELQEIMGSGKVTVNTHVAALEKEVSERLEVPHVIAVSCGTSGLMLLLRALNLPRGSEVIVPSFTFAATAHALLWNDLKPVFCDSDPDTFTMDADAADQLVNSRTSAIYPVCIFGTPGDMDAYTRVAQKHGLALLFDSAQGLGSSYKGVSVGCFGFGEVFSLSPTKVVTAMEGGLITLHDDRLAEVIRRMRDYGKAPDGEDMNWLGLSARMEEVNALVARWSLARVEMWIANRQAAVDRYKDRLRSIPAISFQRVPEWCRSCWNYFVILVDPELGPVTRDELYLLLKERGIQTKRYFYPPLHRQTLYKDLDPCCHERLQVADRISARSIALPLYSHMSTESVDEICNCLIELFAGEKPPVYEHHAGPDLIGAGE